MRDAQRALTLLDKIEPDSIGDPSELEIRAAAQAATGGYAQAVKTQREAIARATKLNWDTAPLYERLLRYQAGQPWFGNLLEL